MSDAEPQSAVAVALEAERLAWVENWADTPSPEEAAHGWAHHGLGLLADGRVVGFHPELAHVVVYEPSGACAGGFATELTEGHGITVVGEAGEERIWIADPGAKMRRDATGAYHAYFGPAGGQVVQFDLDGSPTMRLERPQHQAYAAGHYAPTSVAVDEVRAGGSGDIWVADGYGESLLHRFSSNGSYLATLDGEEGPSGRFDCPHGLLIDRRRGEPELLVADRGNALLRVYTLDGTWKRDIGRSFLNSPSSLAIWGERTIVAELRARLAVIGPDERLLGYLGEHGDICEDPGWPNSLDPQGHAVRQADLLGGRFNSPHGLIADGLGNVFVAEWLIGGRMIKLEPLSAT